VSLQRWWLVQPRGHSVALTTVEQPNVRDVAADVVGQHRGGHCHVSSDVRETLLVALPLLLLALHDATVVAPRVVELTPLAVQRTGVDVIARRVQRRRCGRIRGLRRMSMVRVLALAAHAR
jgi:hypothetical protein